MRNKKTVRFSAAADEVEWLAHAASLRHLSVAEYVKRAINAQLRREGVDAVLFAQSDECK